MCPALAGRFLFPMPPGKSYLAFHPQAYCILGTRSTRRTERTIEWILGSVPQEFSHIPSDWSRVIQCRGFPGKYNEGEGCKWLEIMGKWYSGLKNLTWQKKKWECDSGLLKGLKIIGIVTRGSERERQEVVIEESEAHSCDLQGDLVNGTDQGGYGSGGAGRKGGPEELRG